MYSAADRHFCDMTTDMILQALNLQLAVSLTEDAAHEMMLPIPVAPKESARCKMLTRQSPA